MSFEDIDVLNSLLAEVSHDETNWNERRETSAGFRRVSYHACPRVSLTTSDVFVTCDTTQRTGLNLSAARAAVEFERALKFNQSWRWNDLASGCCRGPHYKSLRKAEEANFKADFSFFTSLLTGEPHVFEVKFIRLYGTVGFIAIRDFSFWGESDFQVVEWHLASDGWSGFPSNRGLSRRGKNERFAVTRRKTRKRILQTKYDFSL